MKKFISVSFLMCFAICLVTFCSFLNTTTFTNKDCFAGTSNRASLLSSEIETTTEKTVNVVFFCFNGDTTSSITDAEAIGIVNKLNNETSGVKNSLKNIGGTYKNGDQDKACYSINYIATPLTNNSYPVFTISEPTTGDVYSKIVSAIVDEFNSTTYTFKNDLSNNGENLMCIYVGQNFSAPTNTGVSTDVGSYTFDGELKHCSLTQTYYYSKNNNPTTKTTNISTYMLMNGTIALGVGQTEEVHKECLQYFVNNAISLFGGYYFKDLIGEDNVLSNTDVAIYFYNVYVSCHCPENYYTTPATFTFDNLWDVFYGGNNQVIFDKITTLDESFYKVITLDFYNCRNVNDLRFMNYFNFYNLKGLCLSGIDLSGYKTTDSLSLSFISRLQGIEILEMVDCNLPDLSFLNNITNTNSLKQVNFMNNNLTSFAPLTKTKFNQLEYANLCLNQATNEALVASFGPGSSYYKNTIVDIGLQRIPQNGTILKSQDSQYSIIFAEKAPNKSNITPQSLSLDGSLKGVLCSSASFDLSNNPETITPDNRLGDAPYRLFSLQHKQYMVQQIEYEPLLYRITNEDVRSTRLAAGQDPIVFTFYDLHFSYNEEEICSDGSQNYNTSLTAYEKNPLVNYSSDHFADDPEVTTYKLLETWTALGSDDFSLNPGTYRIDYKFTFKTDFVTNTLQNSSDDPITITISKTIKVFENKIIYFAEEGTTVSDGNYYIYDANLYKSLLFISGKVNNTSVASQIPNSVLGSGDYILYSQDFYFKGLSHSEMTKPSIFAQRKANNQVLIDLDLTKNISSIAKNVSQPITNITGLECFNLSSIETLTLNKLGFSDISMLLSSNILPNIKTLNAGGNNISQINNIADLTTLEYLDLSFNQIEDASPLKDMIDPSTRKYNNEDATVLKLVNLAFNQLSIKGNYRSTDGQNNYAYESGGKFNNTFLISSTTVDEELYPAPSTICIVLVQCLQNYDQYINTSKWEFYYTSAVGNYYKTFIKKNSNANDVANFSNYYDSVKKTYSSYSNFSITSGDYTAYLTYQKITNHPFKDINILYSYTVTIAQINSLSSSVNFKDAYNRSLSGGSILAAEPTKQYTSGRSISTDKPYNTAPVVQYSYTMISSEYDAFIDALTNGDTLPTDKVSSTKFSSGFAFKNYMLICHKNDITVDSNISLWRNAPFYETTSSSNYPINIVAPSHADYTHSSTYSYSYAYYHFHVYAYRANNTVSADVANIKNDATPVIVDSIRLTYYFRIYYNRPISIKDENLSKALCKQLGKNYNTDQIYQYDFYKAQSLDLSNSNISTFETVTTDSGNVYGFESLQFSQSMKTIDVSHNKLTNTAISDVSTSNEDSLTRLLVNSSLFGSSSTSVTLLDLSYNKLVFISSIYEICKKYSISINMFANDLDFFHSANYAILQSADYTNKTKNKCTFSIGIQGISNAVDTKISFKQEILRSSDTFAKFYTYNESELSGTASDCIAPYSTIEYVVYNKTNREFVYMSETAYNEYCATKEDSDPNYSFKIYYYKDAGNYNVTYHSSTKNNVNVTFEGTIKHQKIYINAQASEDGSESNDKYVIYDYKSRDNLEEYEAYKQEILSFNIFTFENCSIEDFRIDYEMKIGQIVTDFEVDELTTYYNAEHEYIDKPFKQCYQVIHMSSGETYESFKKIISIQDLSSPTISLMYDTSATKYVITKGGYYSYYKKNHIDDDILVYDDYDCHQYTKTDSPITDIKVSVTIYKDDKLYSVAESYSKDYLLGFSIDPSEVGVYKIVYIATDSNGNKSEPFEREIQVYYQPYNWVKISDFSSQFTAGYATIMATVYRGVTVTQGANGEEQLIVDENKNPDPTFYWYVDGEFVTTSKASAELSSTTNFCSEVKLMIAGAGTHSVEVYIDITKEAFLLNSEQGLGANLASNIKSTSVFVLMDDQVASNTLIGIACGIAVIIIIIIVIRRIRINNEKQRNKYEYSIEKHNKK